MRWYINTKWLYYATNCSIVSKCKAFGIISAQRKPHPQGLTPSPSPGGLIFIHKTVSI